jgi:hypothetical protein
MRKLALACALALPLAGLAELALSVYFARRAPRFDDYAVLREPLGRLHQPGDLVLVAPRWAEPLARRALGDELFPLRDLGRPDESGYGHAIEVSALGEHDDAVAGWRELERTEAGPFVVRRLESPAPRPPVFDFVDALGPDQVAAAMEPGGPCRWRDDAPVASGGLGGHPTFPRQRFDCPGGAFFHVSVTVIADRDFRPRRCLWAHPPGSGELVVRYRDVPLGDVIDGHGGLYWMVERERAGAPITLRVAVDGEDIGSVIHRDGDGWAAFSLALGAHARATAGEVTFAVSSPDNRHRHFCFEARSR